jgi:hypothetical protein
MENSNPRAANKESKIQCIEVLVPKKSIATSGHNLHWTLSVYSLENQPVTKTKPFHNSEVFHFMVYDWKRTIKQLLEDHQIHYSIIQYFTAENLYTEAGESGLAGYETGFFSALNKLNEASSQKEIPAVKGMFSGSTMHRNSDLILDERSN